MPRSHRKRISARGLATQMTDTGWSPPTHRKMILDDLRVLHCEYGVDVRAEESRDGGYWVPRTAAIPDILFKRPVGKRLVGAAEATRILGIGNSQLHHLAGRGKLPSLLDGSIRLFPEKELRQFIGVYGRASKQVEAFGFRFAVLSAALVSRGQWVDVNTISDRLKRLGWEVETKRVTSALAALRASGHVVATGYGRWMRYSVAERAMADKPMRRHTGARVPWRRSSPAAKGGSPNVTGRRGPQR